MFCLKWYVLNFGFCFLLSYKSIKRQWSRIGKEMYIGDMFLLIEMAHKTKKTLTRAQMTKIWEENPK